MNHTAVTSALYYLYHHFILSVAVVLLSSGVLKCQDINTIAGNGTTGSSGDGGLAMSAELNNPTGIALDDTGNIYIADNLNNKIRRISASNGIIITIAGTGNRGYSGDKGPATVAELNLPLDVILDKTGNIYISDMANNVIRKITAGTGIITTIAGNGTPGYGGDGIAATSASFYFPAGLAVDSGQNLYIADQFNNRVRQINATSGIINTVAGNGDASGKPNNGGPATSAVIVSPEDVKFDASWNMYITDFANYIRKVDAHTQTISSIGGDGVEGYSGDGGPATSAEIDGPLGLAIDGLGNVYLADIDNSEIRKITASSGMITDLAGIAGYPGYSGDGGLATSAEIYFPSFMTLDHSGNLIFADEDNNRVRIITHVTSIESISSESDISVYPNPVTNGNLYLDVSEKTGAEKNISIYDMSGNLIVNEKSSSVFSPVKIPVDKISPGMYFLRVQMNNGVNYIKKIVIIGQ